MTLFGAVPSPGSVYSTTVGAFSIPAVRNANLFLLLGRWLEVRVVSEAVSGLKLEVTFSPGSPDKFFSGPASGRSPGPALRYQHLQCPFSVSPRGSGSGRSAPPPSGTACTIRHKISTKTKNFILSFSLDKNFGLDKNSA